MRVCLHDVHLYINVISTKLLQDINSKFVGVKHYEIKEFVISMLAISIYFLCILTSIFNPTFSSPTPSTTISTTDDETSTDSSEQFITTDIYAYKVPDAGFIDDDSSWTVISHDALHVALNSTDDSLDHDDMTTESETVPTTKTTTSPPTTTTTTTAATTTTTTTDATTTTTATDATTTTTTTDATTTTTTTVTASTVQSPVSQKSTEGESNQQQKQQTDANSKSVDGGTEKEHEEVKTIPTTEPTVTTKTTSK
ncbi:unnamed protein product [Heterobilharzia americana]|nr:unnamed protein product [Heterobilharzia americana]